MMTCFKATVLVLLTSRFCYVTAAKPVKVSVYYESLCPTSQKFIVNQLYPVWHQLRDIITLDINAYGKTKENRPDGWESGGVVGTCKCQHGPKECKGNAMLTCAKKYIPDEAKFLNFTTCVMSKLRSVEAGPECANESEVGFAAIEECYTSSEGQFLLHEVGLRQNSLTPSLDYVPWILINDRFTRKQLRDALADLKEVVCNAYQGDAADLCD